MVLVDLCRGSWDPSFDGGGQEEWVTETEYLATPTKIVAKAVMPGTWNMIPKFRPIFSHEHKIPISQRKKKGHSLQ